MKKNQTVFTNLTIKYKDKVVFEGYGYYFKVRLWKGDYQVQFSLKDMKKKNLI